MRLLILTAILFAFGCADCPSSPEPVDPCAYTFEQFRESLGQPYPRDLDLDGDGRITSADFAEWTARCQ